jgi:hypothetical protein
MDGIRRELDYFSILSGLKVIILKTKMIWIGSKTLSKDEYHYNRWVFEWNRKKF